MDAEESKVQESSFVPLWRKNEQRSLKSGQRHTIYWVKRNPKHIGFEKDGALVAAKEPSKFVTACSYSGGWLHNQKHGFGTQVFSNGKKYEGDFRHGQREGTGTLWKPSNGKLLKEYTGEWKNNKRHGVGVHYDDLGNKYEGSWIDGKKSGKGRMFYVNGDIYEGEFTAEQRSGIGILHKANGDRYEGHWLHDKKEGPGRYYFASTRKVLQAEFVNDAPTCGVFSEWPQEDESEDNYQYHDAESKSERVFTLPPLTLATPDSVLHEAFQQTRKQRTTELGKQMTDGENEAEWNASETFSQSELDDIHSVFTFISDGRDSILGADLEAVLNELGLHPQPEDVEQLLDELGATVDSEVTFAAFVGMLATLRAPEEPEEI